MKFDSIYQRRNSEKMIHLAFSWTDYILFGSLLGFSLLIGIYFGFFSKQDSVNEYLYGGKTMGYIPIATSIIARFVFFHWRIIYVFVKILSKCKTFRVNLLNHSNS